MLFVVFLSLSMFLEHFTPNGGAYFRGVAESLVPLNGYYYDLMKSSGMVYSVGLIINELFIVNIGILNVIMISLIAVKFFIFSPILLLRKSSDKYIVSFYMLFCAIVSSFLALQAVQYYGSYFGEFFYFEKGGVMRIKESYYNCFSSGVGGFDYFRLGCINSIMGGSGYLVSFMKLYIYPILFIFLSSIYVFVVPLYMLRVNLVISRYNINKKMVNIFVLILCYFFLNMFSDVVVVFLLLADYISYVG